MKDMKSNRFAFQLVPKMHRTEGIDSGLLPTANAQSGGPSSRDTTNPRGRQSGNPLKTAIAMLSTPTGQEVESQCELTEKGRRMTKDGMDSHSLNLARQIAMLTTPRAREGNCGEGEKGIAHGVKKGYLDAQIAMLPTPRGSDVEGGALTDVKWNEQGFYRENQIGVRWGVKTRDAIATIGKNSGLKLQPAFVEWMMGYPDKWTELTD